MAVSSSSPAIIFAVTVLMLLTVSSVKLPFHPSGPAPALAQTTLLAASQLFQLRRGVERCLLLQEQGVFGGGTLHIKVDKAHSWTCMDIYVFVTPYRVTWDWYFISREHTMEFSEWEGKAEYEYVKQAERCFMEAGMVGTLRALWDVFPLFTNTGWGENSNIAFLEKHMGANFYARPQPWGYKHYHRCNPLWRHASYSKIRGPWGGFETMEKWVSGAYAGHTAVCLRDSDGKLWVGESGNENEKGEDVIAVLPWEEWWEFEQTKDDANPHIALLPLHPDYRAKFNVTAAWEYARSMDGKPYGYHSLDL
ncbi:unnamed protein product [Brassica rapa subsp. narinosa]